MRCRHCHVALCIDLEWGVVQCSGSLQFCIHCEPRQALVHHAGHSRLHTHREKDLLAVVDCVDMPYVMGGTLRNG